MRHSNGSNDFWEFVKVSAPVVGPDVPVAIARMHYDIECAIEHTAMESTMLRPYAFMQNLLNGPATTINHTGMFFGITDQTKFNLVDARDISDVAVTAHTNPSCPRGPLVLTGPRTWSYPEIAQQLSVEGKRITYVNQRVATARRGLQRAGLPPWLIEHILEIQNLAISHPETPTTTVQTITGRAPRTLEQFLTEHADAFNPPRWTKAAPFRWLTTRALGSRPHAGQ